MNIKAPDPHELNGLLARYCTEMIFVRLSHAKHGIILDRLRRANDLGLVNSNRVGIQFTDHLNPAINPVGLL